MNHANHHSYGVHKKGFLNSVSVVEFWRLCLFLLRFTPGNEAAASLVARGAVKNVVDDSGIDIQGFFG